MTAIAAIGVAARLFATVRRVILTICFLSENAPAGQDGAGGRTSVEHEQTFVTSPACHADGGGISALMGRPVATHEIPRSSE
jgi:hypothetical protein